MLVETQMAERTKGAGRTSGVYFTPEDLAILDRVMKRMGLDRTSVLRVAIRNLEIWLQHRDEFAEVEVA